MNRRSCRLLVAGGGVAGVCAAVAASRCGVTTLLVETHPLLGGGGTSGLLRHICGLFATGDAPPAETLNGGLTREIVQRLRLMAPERTARKIGRLYVLPYGDGDLLRVLTELCAAEKYLKVQTSATVSAVRMAGDRIAGVTLSSPRGAQVMVTEMAIDCTGNADLALLAGARCDLAPPAERQLAGFTIRVVGLTGVDDMLPLRVAYHCARGVRQGALPPLLRFTGFFPGDGPDEGYCKLSLDGEQGEGRERRAREWALELIRYLGEHVPPFGRARIEGTALRVLDREGRRVGGEYTLTEDDILSARRFPDGVVRSSWPVELWDSSSGPLYRYPPPGAFYEIPLRCLRVQGVANLLAAGRCISATREALASTRVMGTCMALGEQAGLEAARRLGDNDHA